MIKKNLFVINYSIYWREITQKTANHCIAHQKFSLLINTTKIGKNKLFEILIFLN